MARQGFVVYHDDYKRLRVLTIEQKAALFDALYRFSASGEATEFDDPTLWVLFDSMAGAIDRDAKRYDRRAAVNKANAESRWQNDDENGCSRMRTDAKGGWLAESKPSRFATEPNEDIRSARQCETMRTDAIATSQSQSQTQSQTQGQSQTQTQDQSSKDEVGEGVAASPSPRGTKSKGFSKPTIEEVRAYCLERGSKVDAARWYAHYEANGWRVGKNPMKNWRAAVRTWEGGYGHGRSDDAAGGAAKGGGDRADLLGTWDIPGRRIL